MNRDSLPGSTLAEMLVVMVLISIILLSVFEGLALFEKLAVRSQTRLKESIHRMSSYYMLEEIFASADSICGDDPTRFRFFNRGECGIELIIIDSALIVRRQQLTAADTLITAVSQPRVVETEGRIDSLVFMADTLEMRFGVRYKENIAAESIADKLEKEFRDENRD